MGGYVVYDTLVGRLKINNSCIILLISINKLSKALDSYNLSLI